MRRKSIVVIVVLIGASLLVSAAPASASVKDADTIEQLVAQPDYNGESHAEILRLYQAIFGRAPDVGGAKYWIGVNDGVEDGTRHGVLAIAGFMSASAEWANNYSGTSDEVFLERVYTNVLGRGYDQSGFNYWLDTLKGTNATGKNPDRTKLNRPSMVFYVTANPEFKNSYPFAGSFDGYLIGDDRFFGSSLKVMSVSKSPAAEIEVNRLFQRLNSDFGLATYDSGWATLEDRLGPCEGFQSRSLAWGDEFRLWFEIEQGGSVFLSGISVSASSNLPNQHIAVRGLGQLGRSTTIQQVADALAKPIGLRGADDIYVTHAVWIGEWVVSGSRFWEDREESPTNPSTELVSHIYWESPDAGAIGGYCY